MENKSELMNIFFIADYEGNFNLHSLWEATEKLIKFPVIRLLSNLFLCVVSYNSWVICFSLDIDGSKIVLLKLIQ